MYTKGKVPNMARYTIHVCKMHVQCRSKYKQWGVSLGIVEVINLFLGTGIFMYAPFDAVVVCCTFCTLLVLNVVWSLIQGIQICKLYTLIF